MGKVSLIFFKRDCMGCHACEVACKQEHGLGAGPRLVRVIEHAPDFTPIYCRHCADAPCAKACTVDAISRNGRGIVLINDDLCIGCKACVEACPFGAMQFDDDGDIAVKCDMCLARQAEGKDPACAAVCPTGCIFWGESRDLSERLACEAMKISGREGRHAEK